MTTLFSRRSTQLFLLFSIGLGSLTGCSSSDDDTPPTPVPPPSVQHSKWISKITSYNPAPGQFINTNQGDPEAAQKIVGGKGGLLSLGGFGGYIVFEFDHKVRNIAGVDFVIHGNAFDGSSEPGIVLVTQDGTTWYELKGSEYNKPETIHNYGITYTRPSQTESSEAIPWTDNQSATGEISTVTAHRQCYYPLFFDHDPLTLAFSGTLLAPNSYFENGKFDQKPYDWGYVDNASEDYEQIVNNDPDTKGSNKFDIDNAVDQNGNPVKLDWIQYIKVYTAVNHHVGGGVGEISTEISGAISLSANLDDE